MNEYCSECTCPNCRHTRAERAKWGNHGNGMYREWSFPNLPVRFTHSELEKAQAEMPPKPRSAYMDPTPYSKRTYL